MTEKNKTEISDKQIIDAIKKGELSWIRRATPDTLRPILRELGMTDEEQNKRLIKMWIDKRIELVEGSPAAPREEHFTYPVPKGEYSRRFWYVELKNTDL